MIEQRPASRAVFLTKKDLSGEHSPSAYAFGATRCASTGTSAAID
jgi:hypothetical protein